MTDQLRALEEQLADDPQNPEIFNELSAQLWADGDWQSVLELYEVLEEQSADFLDFSELAQKLEEHAESLEPGEEKGTILLLLGDLYHEYIGAYEEGMDAYQDAFRANPDDVTPLRQAREIYRRQGKWSVLVEIYNVELRVTPAPEQKVTLLSEVAQVQGERIGDFEAALATLGRIEELGSDDPFAEQLRWFYEQQMSVEDGILDALSRAESALNDDEPQVAADAFIEAAQLEYDRHAGSAQEAMNLARQALEADSEQADAKLIVDELQKEIQDDGEQGPSAPVDDESSVPEDEQAEGQDAEDEQAEEQEKTQEKEGPRTVESFYAGIDAFDGDVEEARAALESDKTNLSALKTVRQDLLDKGDAAGLAEVLENSVRYFRKKEGEWEVMTELANINWLQLGDDDQAEYYFKRLKLLDADHPDVFKFYEAYYEAEGNWRKLFTLLAGRLEHIEDREDYRLVVEQLSEIAEVELGSPEKAIDVWKGFSRQFPDDEEGRRRLQHLYEDHEKWNALAELLKEQVRELAEQGEETAQERVSILEEMAHIYRSHLGLDTMVMNIMADILELDPDHPSAYGQLRDLYESKRRYNDLATLLADKADRAAENGNVGMAVGTLLEVADLWEDQLNNQTQAIPHLERIVEIAPEEAQVRDRLREIYEKRRDFSSLFDLRLQESQLMGTEERLDELEELLTLSRQKLQDPEREADVLNELLEERPDDLELVEALQDARERLEDWQGVAEVLERKAQLLSGDDGVDALSYAAQIRGEKLEQIEEATRLWWAVRDEAPEREEAFLALSDIFVAQREYDELQKLYLEAGAGAELFELYGELAEERGEEAVALYRRQVHIADEELNEPQQVIEALETLSLVSEEPDEVRRELLDWYRNTDDIDAELETRITLLDSVEDDDEIFDQIATIADLEEQRDQPDAALGWAMKAFEKYPERKKAFERAEELARQVQMISALVDQAIDVAESLDDTATREAIWADCARLQWQELEAYEEAIERYEILRDRHPDEFEFLEALDDLYKKTEQPQERLRILQEQIDLLRDRGAADVDLVDQLSKVADVQRTHLGESEAARETYSEILDLEPEHLGAVKGLKELHRDDERWMDVVEYLLREIPLAAFESPEAQWNAKLELANVYRVHLDDLHEALRYYGEILGENPEFEAALEAVRQLLAEDGLAREAAMLLEPIFRDLQQYAPLAEALEARLRVCEDPFEEQEILDELIPIYSEELDETQAAFEYARRQFEIDPERDDIWLRFEQLGAKLNEWELIEEMFTRESPLEGHESSTRYDLLRHLAAIREHRLQKTEGALEAWKALHEYDSYDTAALEALERLYRKLDEPQRLVDVLRERAELVDVVDDRIELLIEAGALLVEELEDGVEASDVFRTVLSIEPENKTAVSRLETLLRQQERWHDLDALLSEQADQTIQPERRREFLGKLAILRYEELDDRPGSVSILCDLLDDDPGDDEVLDFARRVDDELAEDDANMELRLDMARTLEPIYRMRGEYDRLDEVLHVRLESADEFQKIELLDEIVELRQKRLSDADGALEVLRQAVVLQPDNEERRNKLLEMASGLDRLVDAVDTLEDAARNADPFVAFGIWKRLGKIVSQRFTDPDRAIEYYEEARQIDDADVEILGELERLFESTSQSERLCENLVEQARFAEPDERLQRLRRVGTLQQHVLDRPIDAIETHRQILEVEPDDLDSIESLEELYDAQDDYFDLVELLRRKVDIVDSEEARVAVLERWAQLAEEELQDLEQTIDIYRRILQEEAQQPEALAQLDRLLADQMQWSEWTEIARQRIEGPLRGRPELRLERELRLAEILVDELFEVEEALQIYRTILERVRHQEDAVAALESLADQDSWLEEVAADLIKIYREREQFQDLLELYERLRDQAMDPQVKAEYDFERGKILRDRLDDAGQAMEAFADAWRQNIEEQKYRRALLDLGTQSESWQMLVELLDEVLDVVVDPELSKELHLMLAQLWQDVLEEPLEAEAHLREVLSAEPLHRDAFETMFGILEEAQRWHDLVDLLEQRHDAIIGDSQQDAIELLMTVATIYAEHLDDEFSAVSTLERVRALDARHAGATEELERLLTEQERWEDLAQFYEDQAASSPLPSERLQSELALAELCRGPLQQVERAIELYGRALDIDSGHEESIQSLETIFEQEPAFRAASARLLEPVYRKKQDDEALVRILQARVDAAEPGEDEQRVGWLRELSALLDEAVDDPRHAWIVAAELFSCEPADEDVRQRFWDLSARARAWRELTDIYASTLEENLAIDDELRAQLRLDLAGLYADRLDDLAKGRESAAAALRLTPESQKAVDTCERLLERQGAWHDLAEFYRERADFSADEEQARHWFEKLAALHEDVLDDVDATVDIYGRLLEIAPGNEEYRMAMERILVAMERWYELADIYRQRIAGGVDEEVIGENRLALAGLLENQLDSLEEAVDLYRQLLEDSPYHSDAIRSLEGLRRDLDTREGDWKPLKREIVDILLQSYDESQAWRRIDDLLDQQVELAEDPKRQVEILVEKSQLLLRSTDDDIERIHALTTLARAFCLDPKNDEIDELIEVLADDLDAWHRIIPIYLGSLGQTDDVDRQGHILAAVAQIYEFHIGDMESAIAAYQQSVEISAESEVALEKLQELYGEMEKWAPLVEILERRMEEIYDPDRQQSLRKRIARIYDEKLGRFEDALQLYEEIRREEPTELSHLVVMERLLDEMGDYQALEELLLDKLQIVDAKQLRADVLKRLGAVRRDHLDRVDDAISSFHDALEVAPDDVEALEALIELYRTHERWTELLDVLASRRDQADGVEETNEIEIEMGDILLDEAEEPQQAFEHYRAALERDGENYTARGALFRLLKVDEVRRQSAEILTELHREQQEWDELEALHQRLIEASDDSQYVAEQFLALARMQADDMGIEFKAFATLGEAMQTVPEISEVRRELEKVADALDSAQDLVAIYEEALQIGVDDPDARRELHLVVGRNYAEEMEQYDDAIPHFEAVLDVDEYDVEALSWLDRIYQAKRDWHNLARVLENKLAVVTGDEEVQAQFQLGYLKENVYEEEREAFDLYRQVLLEVPDHSGAIEGLERLFQEPELGAEILELLEPTYRENESWAKLARLFVLKLDSVEHSSERAGLLRQAAQIEFDELNDVDAAFEHWCQALQEDPHDGEVQNKLEDLADKLGLYDELIDVYEQIVDELGDPVRQLELAEKAGGWAMDYLEDPSRAAASYRRVLEVEPEHEEALEILEKVAREEGDDESLAAVLAARVQSSFDEDEQIALYTELASVRLGLEDYDGAIEAFEQLMILDGESLERLETLAHLLELTERSEERADILERILPYREDAAMRFETLHTIGTICLEQVQDYTRARRALEKALELEAGDGEVMQALEDVYEQLEDWSALQELIDRQLESVDDESEALRLYIRRAEVRYEADGDVDGAIEDYQTAFAIRDDHPEIIEALGRLYRSEERYEDLIGLLNNQVNQATDEEAAHGYLLEMAAVAHEELGALERAAEFAEPVLESNPENQKALDRLEAIYRSQGAWEKVVEVIDHRIDGAANDSERTELLGERARTLYEDAGALQEAAQSYQTLLNQEPDNEELIEVLDEIYSELDDGEGLYELLAHRAQRADDEERIVELYLQMGEVARTYLGGGEPRIQALEAARQYRGDDLDIVEPLLDAYIEGERFDDAEPLLESVIETLTDARKMKEVVRFHHLRGKLAQQQGDMAAAQNAYEEAHRLDATYIPNLLSLGKLFFNQAQWEDAKKIFQILLLHQMNIKDDADKVEVYFHLGAIREQMGEERGARDMYKRALRVDSNHADSKAALAAIEG